MAVGKGWKTEEDKRGRILEGREGSLEGRPRVMTSDLLKMVGVKEPG